MSSIAAAIGTFLVAQACLASIDAGHEVGDDPAWSHAGPSARQAAHPERARARIGTGERSTAASTSRMRRTRVRRANRLTRTSLRPLRRRVHSTLPPDPHRAVPFRMRQRLRAHLHFATEHDRTRTGMLTSWSPITPPRTVG